MTDTHDNAAPLIPNRDYVMIRGLMTTPANLVGRFNDFRERYFDLPLTIVPRVDESGAALNNSSPDEIRHLNHDAYNLEDPLSDRRLRNDFDIFEKTLLALQNNTNVVFSLKRKMTFEKSEVEGTYYLLFNQAMSDLGSGMGKNKDERIHYMYRMYPALVTIKNMYDEFYSEIEIELQRLTTFQQMTSRAVASAELSYQATGKLLNQNSHV